MKAKVDIFQKLGNLFSDFLHFCPKFTCFHSNYSFIYLTAMPVLILYLSLRCFLPEGGVVTDNPRKEVPSFIPVDGVIF